MNKTLRISPPDGEFTVMNYRINGDFSAPFRVFPFIEEISSSKVEVTVKIRACYDKDIYATHASIKIPIPQSTANAYTEVQKNVQFEQVPTTNFNVGRVRPAEEASGLDHQEVPRRH
jgi:AP-4 complex subunit mu-1